MTHTPPVNRYLSQKNLLNIFSNFLLIPLRCKV
jgi:hypothetical protein